MSSEQQLEELYREISDKESVTLFVAPPIRFGYKQSDYLYLLYKEIFKSSSYQIKNISPFKHPLPFFHNLQKLPSIFHYHWLECTGFLNLPRFFYQFISIVLYKLTGGHLVWTIHNKMPLDGKYKWLNFRARRWMAKNAVRIHVQCKSAIPKLSSFYDTDESKFFVIPHPKYPPVLMPRAAAVEAINLRFDVNIKMQDRLFLMIGHISEYKQIEEVCEIFKNEPIQKKLIIAGPVKKGQMKLFKRLKKKTRDIPNIFLIPQFIKEECVPEFLNAADYLVFNFKDVITSGGVHLAISYNKKTLLPDTECMRELDNEYFRFFSSTEQLRDIIKES
jgi:beta-1,4-mannosyltransferase